MFGFDYVEVQLSVQDVKQKYLDLEFIDGKVDQ